MPILKKLLSKLSKEDREILEPLIEKVISLDWQGQDIKKLQGYQNIFRLRKGKIRIIFAKDKKEVSIISIERRSDKTYRF